MNAATGRADYDQLFKTGALGSDEPRFVLRAGDAVAADAVRAWAALAHKAGTPAEAIELALQQADRMEAWPQRKVPDGPEMAASERLNLRNLFSRRAWSGRDLAPTAEVALAQQLGADAVLGRLKPLLTDLVQHLTIDHGHIDADRIDGMMTTAAGEALERIYAIAGQDLRSRLEAARK